MKFTWYGKENAIIESMTPSTGTLRPDKESSKNWDDTENLYIEGDNLEVLKLLQKSYFGKVKMIYIDPPYNTGNDFIYPDNFRDNITNYKEITSQTTKANPETNGRYHTDWLNMMYPRLKLARNLLREDGVIFISIDDNEYCHMKKICDEIFGEDNLETIFYIKVRHENRILRQDIRYQTVLEHLLCYRKTSKYEPNRIIVEKNTENEYIYDIEINNQPSEVLNIKGYKVEKYYNDSYRIVKSKNGLLKKYQIRGSLISQSGSASEYYEQNLRERRSIDGEGTLYKVIGMGERGDGLGYRYIMQPDNPQSKNGFYFQGRPITSKKDTGLPYANFYDFVVEYNNVGYEGNINFKNGKKPIKFLNKIFEIAKIGNEKDCIVLDFFSGSCSTAHSLMELNKEDFGKRKFIMVQLPEIIEKDSTYYENGFDNICEIGKERIRRSGDKIISENKDKEGIENLDIGFKVFKLEYNCGGENYSMMEEGIKVDIIKRPKDKPICKFKVDGGLYYLVKTNEDIIIFPYKSSIKGKAIASIFNIELCKNKEYMQLEYLYNMKLNKFNGEDFGHSQYVTSVILDNVYKNLNE